MATQPVLEQIFDIPLSDIKLSKTNPRGHIDEQELAELADDIKSSRVHEPVLVRPLQGAKEPYELVFGERRYRASRLAGKQTIPSMVRKMSDEEAEDAQIIENLQRADLHPLDNARSFERLYAKRFRESRRHDDAIAFVAGKVHKTLEFVARCLKLNDLVAAAQKAFREGKLLAGHAAELARLREDEQKRALQWMLESHKDVNTANGWKKIHLIPGVPELKLWIQQNLFRILNQAPFDTGDPNLNPKMGACTDCKFRSGNQPALFGDVKAGDVCTAPPCWVIKRNAALLNQAQSLAKELGVRSVLKVGLGYASWNNSKFPVDVYIDSSAEARIVKKGSECKDTKPGVITWIGQSGGGGSLKVGDPVYVCAKAQSCPTHKKVDSRAARPRKSYEQMADTRVENLRQETSQRVRAALIRAVVEKARKEGRTLSASDKIKFNLMARQMHHDLFFDRHRDLCKLMGAEPAKHKTDGKNWRGASESLFEGNPVALMTAMALMHRYHTGSYHGAASDPLPPLLQVYKVNARAVERETRVEISGKIQSIQAALKRRKAKQAAKASSGHRTGAAAPGKDSPKAVA